MTVSVKDIQVGETYRFFSHTGRELLPRTVVRFDRLASLHGGRVSSHTGITRNGRGSQCTTMAGTYFAKYAAPLTDGESADGEKK